MPFIPGILRSIKTTSGWVCEITSNASAPSWATPTTSISEADFKIVCRPSRTTSWSSQINTRIIAAFPFQLEGGPAFRSTIQFQFTAEHLCSLTHTLDTKLVEQVYILWVESAP